jgi:hypothetical protein
LVKLRSVPTTLIQPAIEYRRIARRVRCRLGKDPVGKQRALAALARHADRTWPAVVIEPLPTPDSGVRAFAQAVSIALEGPILRYSRRQQLIRQAEGLGIRRFDANLLIAAVQHRLGNGKTNAAVQPEASDSRWRMAIPVGCVLALQALILLGFWQVLHGS